MAEYNGVTYCDTVEDTYNRARTGLAMALGEANKATSILRERSARLRAEADEIDEFLKSGFKHTNSWYEIIAAEADAIRLARLKL